MKASIALPIAQEICRLLQPYCAVIKIAGSIRRLCEEVKDIEVVALPFKAACIAGKDLFGNPIEIKNPAFQLHDGYVKEVNSLGKVIKGKPDGRYMQIELPEGIKLDLFTPEEYDFYRQFAIRTGSAEFAQKRIASAWRKIGWVGTKDGLRKESDCENKITPSGSSWVCINKEPEYPPVWQSEKEFFEWLKLPYVEPAKRNI